MLNYTSYKTVPQHYTHAPLNTKLKCIPKCSFSFRQAPSRRITL